MPRWTEKQKTVIDHRGASLMVSAAAGSGKTAVMVERIRTLVLQDRVDVSELLVVTFTRAAAAEMKERIAQSLEDALTAGTADTVYLRQQLDKLDDASISTLHTFCADVLRQYYALIDLDPGFRLASEEETELLWNEAADTAMETLFSQEDADFLAMVQCWGGRDGQGILRYAEKAYQYAMARPLGLQHLDALADKMEAAAYDPVHSAAYAVLQGACMAQLQQAKQLQESALELVQEPGGPCHYEPAICADGECLLAAQAAIGKGWEAGMAALNFTFAKLSSKRYPDKARADAVKARRKGVKDLVDSTQKLWVSLRQGKDALLPMVSPVRGLVKMVRETAVNYAREKSLRDVLDFHDLEHCTLDVLSLERVREELRSQYRYVFVDEYQDTNGVQEAIVTAVTGEDNLFCVGDVKQSIYRFRQADPSLFLRRYAQSSAVGEGLHQRIDLNQNFRSHPGILEGINAIFSRVMSPFLGDIVYDDAAALYPGAARPEEGDTVHPIRLALIDDKDQEDEPEDELHSLGRLESQAMYAAQFIKERISRPIWDGKLNAFRPVEYGDFAILLRAVRGRAPQVADVLRAQGIPVVADGGEGYYDQTEVAQVLDCLAWIDHQERDLSLIHVLHSGMGRFSMDELFQVRRAYPQEASFCRAAICFAQEEEGTLALRLSAFLHLGESWRHLARHARVEEVIWQVLEDTGFYDWVGALPGGDVRQGNLQLLCQQARSLEKSWARSLYGFLSHVERVRDSQTRLAEAQLSQERNETVRIMTIHSSKGLEFPVVILLDLDRGITSRDNTDDLLYHDSLGIAPRSFYPQGRVKTENLLHQAAAYTLRQEGLSEQMRVLYVAMTRAREELVLVGQLPSAGRRASWCHPLSPAGLSQGNVSYLDWIAAVVLRGQGGGGLAELVGYQGTPYPMHWPWKVEILSKHACAYGSQSLPDWQDEVVYALQTPPDPDLLHVYAWQYPYPTYPLPGKTSATAILHESRNLLEGGFAWRELPSPIPKGEPGTAMERGTWMHTLLEALRPGMTRADEVLNQLIAQGILPPEARQDTLLQDAQAFLKSELLQRVACARQIMREQPFVLEMDAWELGSMAQSGEKVLVQGILDLAFLETDGWVLVDYKTNRIQRGEEAALLAWYQPQLKVYRTALAQLTGHPVKAAGLYLTRTGQVVWE